MRETWCRGDMGYPLLNDVVEWREHIKGGYGNRWPCRQFPVLDIDWLLPAPPTDHCQVRNHDSFNSRQEISIRLRSPFTRAGVVEERLSKLPHRINTANAMYPPPSKTLLASNHARISTNRPRFTLTRLIAPSSPIGESAMKVTLGQWPVPVIEEGY